MHIIQSVVHSSCVVSFVDTENSHSSFALLNWFGISIFLKVKAQARFKIVVNVIPHSLGTVTAGYLNIFVVVGIQIETLNNPQ